MILIGRGLDFRNDLESNWKHKLKNLGLQILNQSLCSCQGARKTQLTISGGNDEGVTPVPIPNTEVKPYVAEDTLESSLGKNTKLPTFFYIPQ